MIPGYALDLIFRSQDHADALMELRRLQVEDASAAVGGGTAGLLDEHLQHCIADAAVLEGPRADQRLDEASAAIARLVRS